jgi:hypothetical protein
MLAVDDEPGMLLAVERVFRNPVLRVHDVDRDVSIQVETAATAEEALERIEADPPDILLLDYKLPGMSGLDLLERVAPLSEDMLTVMMTAYASLETAVAATKSGAYDFLAKPFTPEELTGTVRKAAGRLLLTRQAREFERERRRVRFQFISVLAHELKAPINAVEGYLRLINDRAVGDDPEAYERMVGRSLVRLQGMRKLIFDLLDLTRIESGEKRRDLQDVDLREVAETAIESFLPDARERDIAIELHADGPAVHPADPGEVEIMLNNLISNAVKYNRDGGRVDVTLSQESGSATVQVADTGIGMTEEEAGKLFKDFVRIRNEKTKNILGSGLGLSTLRKLAQLYHGDVTVESEPDVGTTFTVILNETEQIADATHEQDQRVAQGA